MPPIMLIAVLRLDSQPLAEFVSPANTSATLLQATRIKK